MKKCGFVFLVLAVLLAVSSPALAAQSSIAPIENNPVPSIAPISPIDPVTTPTPTTSAPTFTPAEEQPEANESSSSWEDAPVDENTYREEVPSRQPDVIRRSGRGTIPDLYQYWEENGYPDYVSYAYKAGGEVVDQQIFDWWEIGLTDNSEARQQEILALASPNCMVEFKTALFTHQEKTAAYQKLLELAETDENILEVIFTRNADTVWVSVPDGKEKEYASYLIRDCGLGAVVSVTDDRSLSDLMSRGSGEDGYTIDPVLTGGESESLVPNTPPALTHSPIFWGCLTVAVMLAATFTALALRRRSVRSAAVTEDGSLHTTALLGRNEVVQAVKDSTQPPAPAVYQSILQKLEEEPAKPVDFDTTI